MPNEIKRALITGASRGIGEMIARQLASEGYDLFLTCSRDIDRLSYVAEELRNKYNIVCVTAVADAGDPGRTREVFSDPFFDGGLDVLVNNAGISYVGLLHEMSDEDWQRVISVNLGSVFYYCREAIPLMLKKREGHIINISSVWGKCGASTEVAYSASKGGVNALTGALAKELAPNGITVNAVACGLIDTSMNGCFTKEELDAVISEIPADRIGKPQEVALAVSRIISMPSYLTGQIITLDGGWI